MARASDAAKKSKAYADASRALLKAYDALNKLRPYVGPFARTSWERWKSDIHEYAVDLARRAEDDLEPEER